MVRLLRAEADGVAVTRGDFYTWLGGLTCTKPFTLDDAKALHVMIKGAMPNAYVDVYWTRGDCVHILIDGALVRDLPVV